MNDIIVIYIDDDLHPSFSSSISMCRICHEQEEDYESLEAPCSCSGTVKFAHRDCVQRWCDEKGDTTCEICMQKFEPGYTCPPPPIKTQSTVTIRASLEVPRNEQGFIISSVGHDASEEEEEADDDTTSAAASSVALVLTALLLVRHLFAVVSGEAETYPFSLLTVLIAKASGILVPMYILTRIAAALRKSITRHRHSHNNQFQQNFDERQ